MHIARICAQVTATARQHEAAAMVHRAGQAVCSRPLADLSPTSRQATAHMQRSALWPLQCARMQAGHRTLQILFAVLVGQHQKCSLLLVDDLLVDGDLQRRRSSAETLGAGWDRIRRPRLHSGLRLTRCEPTARDRGMGAAKRPSPSSSSARVRQQTAQARLQERPVGGRAGAVRVALSVQTLPGGLRKRTCCSRRAPRAVGKGGHLAPSRR